MGQYVGLDASLEETKVHVLDEQGKRVWRGTCVSHPAVIEATIRKHAPEAVRIGLETGPLTTWLWQALTEAGVADGLPGCPSGQGGAGYEDQQDRCQRRRGLGAPGAFRLVPRGAGE